MFVVLVCIRKRREIPYIAIPLCFALAGAIGVALLARYVGSDKIDKDDVAAAVAFPLACNYAFYTLGHQIFASLYLRAARSLTIMFSVAKLEQSSREPDRA